jgi:diguanylate cyclase (GGDEF)-like protein
MAFMVRGVCALALCLLSHISFAQYTNYNIELLNGEDGFVSSEIYSIVQDHHGFLWFGTAENGLMNYDGKKVSLFESDIGNPSSLSHNNAGNIILEDSGAIWVGTWGGGANRYDPKTNIFQHFKNDPDNSASLSSNRVQSMHQDVTGTLWFGTYADGLNRYVEGSEVFERFLHDETVDSSISNNRVWVIRDAGPEALWVGTSYGLNLYDKATKKFSAYIPEPDRLDSSGKNQIRHILQSKQGDLYLGTEGGVLVFDRVSETFKIIKGEAESSMGKIYSLIEERSGLIWAATNLGLYQLIPGQKEFKPIKMPNEGAIRIVFEDRQGIIWATSETFGIYKITRNRNFFGLQTNTLRSPNGLLSDSDGNLIFASAEGAVGLVQKNTKKVLELSSDIYSLLPIDSTARKNAQQMQSYKPVLHQSGDSTLWFAQQSSLLKYDIATNTSSEIIYPYIREIRALNSTADGRIWIGTYKDGIYIYNPAKTEFVHLMHDPENPFSLSHAEVLVIYRDKLNRLWVGTGSGLNLWDDSKQQFYSYTEQPDDSSSILGNIIQAIYQTDDGSIWVGTKKGLNRLDSKTNKFERFSTQNDLNGGQINNISDDDEVNLWLATNTGITKINPKTKEIKNYNQDDGLLGGKYYTNALAKLDDGDIYISGPRGIDYFNPMEVKHANNNLKVVLTGFQKMGSDTLLDKPFSYAEDIFLSHNENFFTLEFASLDLYAPQKNKYAYMLEGFDNNWVYIGSNNRASYTNLDGGTYLFKVKTSSGDDEWTDGESIIRITITPPLWKTWWAYFLYTLTIIACLVLYVRYRTQAQNIQINQQRLFVEALEQQVAEKTASLSEKTAALEATNIELEELTYSDALSGLYNRRYFDRRLLEEITRHKRQEDALALIICDIDFFKLYNDEYGHIVGDKCIQKVSECMSNTVSRLSDAICRYGGEEFALILPNTNVEKAIQVVETIMQVLAASKIEHCSSPANGFVTMSYGIYSTIPKRETSPEKMIKAADKALYASKDSGRNCYTVAE